MVVFDVNETLSNLSPIADRFVEVGLPGATAALWFASLLRDGFALTAAGDEAPFALMAAEGVRLLAAEHGLADVDGAVHHVMDGMGVLQLHADVPTGVRALKATGRRLVTLSNGSTEVAERLFRDAGILDDFDLLLSVAGASRWKPAPEAYRYAAARIGAPPENLLLVAVHPWDIHGAARAGLRTAWVNRAQVDYPDYFTRPDHTVRTVAELAAVLDRW